MSNKSSLKPGPIGVFDSGYGGLTVLDENRIQSSFYEIIFDIVKSPTDPVGMDYDFKVNISPLIW